MPDRSAPDSASSTDSSPAASGPLGPGRSMRMPGLWHRVRSGEDPVAFGAVVLVLALGAGLLWFWMGARHGGVPPASAAPGVVADPPVPPHAAASGITTSTGLAVTVHVAGAVASPGLRHLPAGSRVADALAAAGGSLPRAELDRLNLAARLSDGQKVWVPRRGEPVLPESAGAGPVGGGAGAGNPGSPGWAEPIDLNAADLAALDSLPGVGPGTAQAILEERTRRGGFRSTRDLLRVPGIGETRFARLKDRVRV